MLVYLSETDLLLVALMLFWLLPYLLTLNHLPLPTCNRCSMLDLMDKCAELTRSTLVRGRYNLIQVKYCEDTRPGHQLEASNKLHKSYTSHFTPSFLVWEDQSIHPTLCII
jgi:hypothetical protein